MTLQQRLARLRVQSLTQLLWTVALSPLLWPLLLIVGLKGLLGVDAYTVLGLFWLGVNLLVELVFVPLAVGLARLKPWNARPRAINSAVASTSPSLKLCPSKVGKEELATFLVLGRCQHLKLGLQKFVCATAAKIRDGRPGYQEERGDNKHGHGSPWLVARVCSVLPTAWPGTIMEQCPLRCSPQSCTARRPVRRGCCGPT